MENKNIDKMVKETVDAVFQPKSLVDKLYQIYSHSCYTNIDYSFKKNDENYYREIRQALAEHEKLKEIIVGMYEATCNMINYLEERLKNPNNLVDENNLLRMRAEKDAYKKIIDLFEDKKSVENYIEQGFEIAQLKHELVNYKKYKLTEDELGIDLNIFIKCLTLLGQNKFTYVYWFDKKKDYFMEAITPTQFLVDMEHKEFVETRRPKGYEQHLKFKEYGIKWALTKEELL